MSQRTTCYLHLLRIISKKLFCLFENSFVNRYVSRDRFFGLFSTAAWRSESPGLQRLFRYFDTCDTQQMMFSRVSNSNILQDKPSLLRFCCQWVFLQRKDYRILRVRVYSWQTDSLIFTTEEKSWWHYLHPHNDEGMPLSYLYWGCSLKHLSL